MTRTSNRSTTSVRESVAALLLAEHAFTQPTIKERSSGTLEQRRRRQTGVVNDAVDEQVATAEG